MRWILAAITGMYLGALAGLAFFLWLLFQPDTSFEGGAGAMSILCGIGLFLTIAGSVIGLLLGLSTRAVLVLFLSFRRKDSPRLHVSPVCASCGRPATPDERARSGLCPGCREPLFTRIEC
ncbi:MAG: hypothetical protein U0835_13695 [Isosphaeraceae bacterium]